MGGKGERVRAVGLEEERRGRARGKIIEMLFRVTAYDKCMPAMQRFCVNNVTVMDASVWEVLFLQCVYNSQDPKWLHCLFIGFCFVAV